MKNLLPLRLKELRTNNDMSQARFAMFLGVAQQTYDGWEQGRTQPDIERLIQLSAYYDVSIDYLIGNANNPYKNEERFTKNERLAFRKNLPKR